MTTKQFGVDVRIRYTEPGSWREGDDVIVERRIKGDEWVKVAGFNSMTNDYAFTEANGVARRTEFRMRAIHGGTA